MIQDHDTRLQLERLIYAMSTDNEVSPSMARDACRQLTHILGGNPAVAESVAPEYVVLYVLTLVAARAL